MRRFKALGRGGIITLGVVAALAIGGAAGAVLTGRTAGISERTLYTHESAAWTTSSTAWVTVPGTSRVTSFANPRMLAARFSAETQCVGSTSGWCSVRVVYINSAGTVFEMSPVSGTDFAFDAFGAADNWESHALERSSPYLAAGGYRIAVQAIVIGTGSLRLDDWTLAIEQHT